MKIKTEIKSKTESPSFFVGDVVELVAENVYYQLLIIKKRGIDYYKYICIKEQAKARPNKPILGSIITFEEASSYKKVGQIIPKDIKRREIFGRDIHVGDIVIHNDLCTILYVEEIDYDDKAFYGLSLNIEDPDCIPFELKEYPFEGFKLFEGTITMTVSK